MYISLLFHRQCLFERKGIYILNKYFKICNVFEIGIYIYIYIYDTKLSKCSHKEEKSTCFWSSAYKLVGRLPLQFMKKTNYRH